VKERNIPKTAQDHHIRDALQVWKGKERAIQGNQGNRNERAIEVELAAQRRQSMKTMKRR